MLIKPPLFRIQLGLFYLLFLILLFQLIPLLTNNIVSENFGQYLDSMLTDGSSEEVAEDSFSEQSFFVQNLFLCVLAIIISIVTAGRYYKKLFSNLRNRMEM